MSEKKKFSELVLEEKEKGNVVFLWAEGAISAPLKEFVEQPTDGLLYDLNRDEATALSWMDKDDKAIWVNNFAVALVIRELKSQLAALEKQLAEKDKRLLKSTSNAVQLGILFEKAQEEIERRTVALLDVVNQACQVDFTKDNKCIVCHNAIGAYEDVIELLEEIGRAKRLPGKLLRWKLIWDVAGEKEDGSNI